MTDSLPLTCSYNLARLGNAGDSVTITADAAQLAAIAAWSEVLSLQSFTVQVDIAKRDSTRFDLAFRLAAEVTQACVVSLEPVPAAIARSFSRELHFTGPTRRKPATQPETEAVLDVSEDEGPAEIHSLHYDLAGPALEEYSLALDPYPRSPGAAFAPRTTDSDPPESPFAALKGLKPGV